MIRIYLQAAPWAVPLTVVVALALLAAHRRVLRADPWRGVVGYLFWLAVAGFLAVTITPNPGNSHVRMLDLTVDVPDLREILSTASQSGLNAVIAMPLGFLAVLLALTTRRAWPLAVAVLLPPLAEGVQWLVVALGRVAFALGDVTANWTGVVLGAAAAAAAYAVGRVVVRTVRSPGSAER